MLLDPEKNYGFTDVRVSDSERLPAWDRFRLERIHQIFRECEMILDFGNSSRALSELFAEDLQGKRRVSVDIDPSQKPDIVADICNLHMFADESVDGIICAAMLEHVYNPFKAVLELHRILKPEGMLFVYVPWIWPYHRGIEFHDYFRYSCDGVRELFKEFSRVELCPVRGRFETVLNLFPRFGKGSRFQRMFAPLIRRFDTYNERFTSGFNVFISR